VPAEVVEAASPLPDFCVDRSAQEDFDAAAGELAAEQTRRAYAEAQQVELCGELEDELVASVDPLDQLTATQTDNVNLSLEKLYAISLITANQQTLEEFSADIQTAFDFDSSFVSTGTGASVTDVPEGFCDQSVYDALTAAQEALASLEEAAAYAEWLAAEEAASSYNTKQLLDEETAIIGGATQTVLDDTASAL